MKIKKLAYVNNKDEAIKQELASKNLQLTKFVKSYAGNLSYSQSKKPFDPATFTKELEAVNTTYNQLLEECETVRVKLERTRILELTELTDKYNRGACAYNLLRFNPLTKIEFKALSILLKKDGFTPPEYGDTRMVKFTLELDVLEEVVAAKRKEVITNSTPKS